MSDLFSRPRSPILCALLGMTALCLPGTVFAQQQKGAARVQPVIVQVAKTDHFVDRVEALGTLRANETITVTATVTETVTAVNFDDGQRVEKGDILVEMTRGEEAAALDAEQATVEEAKRQLERLRPLVKSGAASKSVLDERQREYETARARLAGVQSRISDRIIIAPFSGVVGLRQVSPGAVLQPGMKITTLDDDSVMKLDFSVPEIFLPVLQPGLEVVATSAPFGDREFRGQIYSVDSQIDPVTRSIMARALVPNDDRLLKPGLLMSVTLLKNPRQALVLPEEAIIPEARRNYVFVATSAGDPATVSKREVRIGARRPGDIEILDGIAAGDLVVTRGAMNMSDGAAVRIVARQEGDENLSELLEQAREAGGREPAAGGKTPEKGAGKGPEDTGTERKGR